MDLRSGMIRRNLLPVPIKDKAIGKQKCRCCSNQDGQKQPSSSPGVGIAVACLRFYKREVSPLLPGSCRFVPTCSDYSIEAYQKYGLVKGTLLTGCRLLRCNPLGPSGFDPPRWIDEKK